MSEPQQHFQQQQILISEPGDSEARIEGDAVRSSKYRHKDMTLN